MIVLGVIGILLSFAGLFFASVRPSQGRAIFAIVLLLMHLGASLAYYLYSQTAWADAIGYYYDPEGLRFTDFRLGTILLVKLIASMKTIMGGSYLDYFLLFQAFGAWGILLMFRVFQEIHDKLNLKPSQLSYLLLLVPGLHFWTSAIGKDAPVFLGISLAVWAAMRLQSRIVPFGLGIVLLILLRPHIALVAMIAVAISTFFDRRSNNLAKAGLLVLALAGSAYVATMVLSTFKVDVTSANSLTDFFAAKDRSFRAIEGNANLVNAPYYVKLFSLLFRPMFVDANGVFGLVASLENVALIGIFISLATRARLLIWAARNYFFVRFSLIFSVTLILLLAAVYYNVGLGLRQKVMIYPSLLSLFVAQMAFVRASRVRLRESAYPTNAAANITSSTRTEAV